MTPWRSSTRRRNRLFAVVAVVATAAGLALLTLVVWWANPSSDNAHPPLVRPTPSAGPSQADSPSPTPSPSTDAATSDATSAITSGLPSAVDLPGLSGEGMSRDVPPLELRITVTSADPIGTVGWVIPMSKEKPSGQAGGVGRSWSLSTTVYGKPDYARVFLQAGPTGAPITCVISINSTVTERRATVGPYGALMCQG